MSQPVRLAFFAVIGAIVLGVLWQTANAMYFTPRSELRAEVADLTDRLRGWEDTLDRSPRLRRELRSLEARTLGGDLETVDHQLRTRLNRIAEKVELSGAIVGTGSAVARQTPARQLFGGRHPAEREARDMIDFIELEGSISGEGSLSQVVALVDRIEAEPWIKRIEYVRIDPRRSGDRFGVTLRLSTLFLPGRFENTLANAEATSVPHAYDAERSGRFAALVESNPFRLPPPEEPRVLARRSEPAAFPYSQWLLTGVAEGLNGSEAWVRNRSSGEAMLLRSGQSINEAVFVGLAGNDRAEFRVGENRFLIAVGGHLGDRTPVSQ